MTTPIFKKNFDKGVINFLIDVLKYTFDSSLAFLAKNFRAERVVNTQFEHQKESMIERVLELENREKKATKSIVQRVQEIEQKANKKTNDFSMNF